MNTVTKDELKEITDKIDRYEDRIRNASIMTDDAYMTEFFYKDSKPIQRILQILFDDDTIRVNRSGSEILAQNSTTKSARFDVMARDMKGIIYDIEFQKANLDDTRERIVEYSFQINMALLPKGFKAKDLKQTVIIFVTGYDPFGLGRALYIKDNRFIPYDYFRGDPIFEEIIPETKDPINIIFNATYKGENKRLRELAADLFETDYEKIKDPVLRKRAKEIKGSLEGKMLLRRMYIEYDDGIVAEEIEKRWEQEKKLLKELFNVEKEELKEKFNAKKGKLEEKFNAEKEELEEKFNAKKEELEEKFNAKKKRLDEWEERIKAENVELEEREQRIKAEEKKLKEKEAKTSKEFKKERENINKERRKIIDVLNSYSFKELKEKTKDKDLDITEILNYIS